VEPTMALGLATVGEATHGGLLHSSGSRRRTGLARVTRTAECWRHQRGKASRMEEEEEEEEDRKGTEMATEDRA